MMKGNILKIARFLVVVGLIFGMTTITEAKKPNPAIDNTVILCSGYLIDVTADPTILPADGESTSAIVATVTTCEGAPVAGHKVKFSISPAGMGSFSGAAPDGTVIDTTDCQGKAEATYIAGTSTGTATITATDICVWPNISDTVTISLFKVEIIADPERIAAGGIDSAAHKADIIIGTQPAMSGFAIDVGLSGGEGRNGKPAKLTIDGEVLVPGQSKTLITGSDGTIRGVITSSNVLESATITACGTTKEVTFEWADEIEWISTPEFLEVPGKSFETLTLKHHNQPLNQHEIYFFVEEVCYWDEAGELKILYNTPESPSDLSNWAFFVDTNISVTDGNGKAQVVLKVHNKPALAYLVLRAYDFTVWTSSGLSFDLQVEDNEDERKEHPKEDTKQGDRGRTVVIDPGHGGKFPGAIGPTGLLEKEVNLGVALKLKEKLEAEDVKVTMTRERDKELDEKWNEDLKERQLKTKEALPSLFVSIHMNSHKKAEIKGTETYIPGDATDKEKAFAEDIQKEVHAVVQEEDRRVKKKTWIVLNHEQNGKTNSVLVECAFISNPDTEKKLKKEDFWDKLAKAMKKAILKHLPPKE